MYQIKVLCCMQKGIWVQCQWKHLCHFHLYLLYCKDCHHERREFASLEAISRENKLFWKGIVFKQKQTGNHKKKKKKKQSCEFIIDLRQYHFSIVGISGSISLIIREEHGIECCHGPLEIVREMMA